MSKPATLERETGIQSLLLPHSLLFQNLLCVSTFFLDSSFLLCLHTMFGEKKPLLATSDHVSLPKHHTTEWSQGDVEAWRALMKGTHDSAINFSYEWRMKQLGAMRRMIVENTNLLVESLNKDLGKEKTEAIGTEISQILGEITYFERNLKNLMKPQHVASPGLFAPAFTWIERRPLLGPAVLVIGPSNYPVSLCCQPAVGSLVAGNPTVIKPSELCPAVCDTLAKLVPQYFDPSDCRVVLGSAEQTKLLLRYPWGKVFFTGSPRVGRLVAQQTAVTLTPTVLELGGKSPCYIDEETCSSFDWKLLANRIMWAKLLNVGQTCAAVDYLIVPQSKVDMLLPHLKEAITTQFGSDPSKGELGRILQAKPHAQRHVDIIEELERTASEQERATNKLGNDKPSCQIVSGGSAFCRPEEKYICPTIVLNPPIDSRVMKEEIFGPILPIVTVKDRQEAIDLMHAVETSAGTPLCMYVFTDSHDVFTQITTSCRAGSVMRNDCLVHLASHQIPFGGLGQSGMGVYHGPHSFNTFSQALPCMYRPLIPGSDLNGIRMHPFGTGMKVKLVMTGLHIPYIPAIFPRSITFNWTLGLMGMSLVLAKLFPGAATFCMQPVLSAVANGLRWLADHLSAGEDVY